MSCAEARIRRHEAQAGTGEAAALCHRRRRMTTPSAASSASNTQLTTVRTCTCIAVTPGTWPSWIPRFRGALAAGRDEGDRITLIAAGCSLGVAANGGRR